MCVNSTWELCFKILNNAVNACINQSSERPDRSESSKLSRIRLNH